MLPVLKTKVSFMVRTTSNVEHQAERHVGHVRHLKSQKTKRMWIWWGGPIIHNIIGELCDNCAIKPREKTFRFCT